MTLKEALAGRRSVRDFSDQPLSRSQLSPLLWAVQGRRNGGESRTAPSAGATYPLEIFILLGQNSVEGIHQGIYHYNYDSHSISRLSGADARPELAGAARGDQGFIGRAPVAIVICADYERTTVRYGRRGERYVHMEAGHAGQNIYLEATALGLATVAVGAFDDEQVRQVLKLEERYRPLYIMPVGKPG